MRKSRLSLLVVATVIATILVAGCTSSNQSSPQVVEHKCFVNDCVNYGNFEFISGQSKRHAVTKR